MVEELTNFLKSTDNLNVILGALTILALIYAMYSKIKYLCLQKATEMVAKAEGYNNLNGQQKFALCITWINQDLPKIFKTSLVQTIIQKSIQYVYDNCYEYANQYVKRRTGIDISTIIENIKEESSKESNSDNTNQIV